MVMDRGRMGGLMGVFKGVWDGMGWDGMGWDWGFGEGREGDSTAERCTESWKHELD